MKRRILFYGKKLARYLGKAVGTSHQIALGVAIGFFVGWLPIVGIQMIVAVIICGIVRANKIVPLLPVWLTNPVTIIPIYSFNYWVGWKITGGPPLSDLIDCLRRMITPPDIEAYVFSTDALTAWWEGVKIAMGELLTMGWDMQLPLWLGCVIVGTVLAVPSYFITLRLVDRFRKTLATKRSMRNIAYHSRRIFLGKKD